MAHDAAATPEVWPEFLKQFVDAVGAPAAFIQRHYLHERRSSYLHTFGISRKLRASYEAYYSRINVWRQHGAHHYVPGRVVVDEQFYPRSLLRRTEFYNDCLRLNDITRCLAGVVTRRGDEVLMLTAMRSEREEAFGDADRSVIQFLLPHVIRAQLTQERMDRLSAGDAALNTLTLGVALLASDRRVMFANREAETILRAADGLRLRDDRLAAASAAADAALQRLIRYALMPDTSMDCPPDVLVPRTPDRLPLHVTAAPLRTTPAAFTGMGTPAAVVIVTDPQRRLAAAPRTLQQTYKLTRREASLATTLAEGWSLAEAAERLDIRYETARTHLRRILSKTETSRQAQLVLLVDRLGRAAALRRDRDE